MRLARAVLDENISTAAARMSHNGTWSDVARYIQFS
jgi:hypothetical protein